MEEIQRQQMEMIELKRQEEGIQEDNKSQFTNEKEIDPQEILQGNRIMNSENRRSEWIQYQVQEMKDSRNQDKLFRKGIYQGAHVAHHSFRTKPIKLGQGEETIPNLKTPKTPDVFLDKAKATLTGCTVVDKKYHNRIANVHRKKDHLLNMQPLDMKYTNTRNEISRAQSYINQFTTSQEATNAAQITNPKWRNV